VSTVYSLVSRSQTKYSVVFFEGGRTTTPYMVIHALLLGEVQYVGKEHGL